MSIYQSALMLSNDKLSYERRPKDLDLMPEVKEESTSANESEVARGGGRRIKFVKGI